MNRSWNSFYMGNIAKILLLLPLLFSECKNTVTPDPVKDLEILKPMNDQYLMPSDVLEIIIKRYKKNVPYINAQCCSYSKDNGISWNSMKSLSLYNCEQRGDTNFDYCAYRWEPVNDTLAGKTVYIKVQKYNFPEIYDKVGPIHFYD